MISKIFRLPTIRSINWRMITMYGSQYVGKKKNIKIKKNQKKNIREQWKDKENYQLNTLNVCPLFFFD